MPEWALARRADGTWEARDAGGARLVVHAVTDGDGAVWVHADGEVFVARPPQRVRRAQTGHGHAHLEAPMPAQVIAVIVAPGDEVSAGATLLLLEAMKMELPLRAPTAGRIAAVHCAVGDRVVPGRALVDLEAEDRS